MQVEWERVESCLATLREMLQREANQGIRRRQIDEALASLAGMDALERLTHLLHSLAVRPAQHNSKSRKEHRCAD